MLHSILDFVLQPTLQPSPLRGPVLSSIVVSWKLAAQADEHEGTVIGLSSKG